MVSGYLEEGEVEDRDGDVKEFEFIEANDGASKRYMSSFVYCKCVCMLLTSSAVHSLNGRLMLPDARLFMRQDACGGGQIRR